MFIEKTFIWNILSEFTWIKAQSRNSPPAYQWLASDTAPGIHLPGRRKNLETCVFGKRSWLSFSSQWWMSNQPKIGSTGKEFRTHHMRKLETYLLSLLHLLCSSNSCWCIQLLVGRCRYLFNHMLTVAWLESERFLRTPSDYCCFLFWLCANDILWNKYCW